MLIAIPELCWQCGKGTPDQSKLHGNLKLQPRVKSPSSAAGAILFSTEIQMNWCSLNHFHSWLEAQSAQISVINDEAGLKQSVTKMGEVKLDPACILACHGSHKDHQCSRDFNDNCRHVESE